MVLNSQTLQAYKNLSLICPMCQKPLPAAPAHSSKKHQALKKLDRHPYDCTVCHKSFKSQSEMAFHIKSSHQVSIFAPILNHKFTNINSVFPILSIFPPRILCINVQPVENPFQDHQTLKGT